VPPQVGMLGHEIRKRIGNRTSAHLHRCLFPGILP
jgi:hypothetical protein